MVRKLRLRYTKRGRLRFTSHRDIARAFERALRRAQLPMAYSAGFNPHPKVSWLGAAPTGTASEAEYVEIGLAELVEPEAARVALDAAMPPGLDVVAAVISAGPGLAERIDASRWWIELPTVSVDEATAAYATFFASPEVMVTKVTKSGKKVVDVRAATVRGEVLPAPTGVSGPAGEARYAILDCVVRHVTPAIRPDDVLTGLCAVADLAPPASVRTTRLAQGLLTAEGDLTDPFGAGRDECDTGVSPA